MSEHVTHPLEQRGSSAVAVFVEICVLVWASSSHAEVIVVDVVQDSVPLEPERTVVMQLACSSVTAVALHVDVEKVVVVAESVVV